MIGAARFASPRGWRLGAVVVFGAVLAAPEHAGVEHARADRFSGRWSLLIVARCGAVREHRAEASAGGARFGTSVAAAVEGPALGR